MKKEHYLK